MKKMIIITMLLFNLIFGAQAQQNNTYTILDTQTFKDSITTKNIQLIDVRTPNEYDSGHIKNAINIDFYSPDFNIEFEKLDKEKPVYIYCRSGSRSKQSADKLAVLGFKIIYDLKGGFLNYN